jgi:hypothetical protein
MPYTSTAQVAAPAATEPRLPLRSSETADAIVGYIIRNLHEGWGPRPDGTPRFVPVPGPEWAPDVPQWAFRSSESGLTFRVKSTGNGISPFLITCTDSAQAVAGSTSAPRNVNVKLHANGEARWNTIHNACLAYAARKTEAAERTRLQEARADAAWAKLARYMNGAENPAHALGIAPHRVGSLDRESGFRDRAWEWRFTLREDGHQYHVGFALAAPGPDEATDDFNPAEHNVTLSLGFDRYATGDRTMPLRDALLMVCAQHAAAVAFGALDRSTSRIVELTDPRVVEERAPTGMQD